MFRSIASAHLSIFQGSGLYLLDNHRTQHKSSKIELHTQFWRQASQKNWDFLSNNDSRKHFSVDSLGKCETGFLPFSVAIDVFLT
jgi:hypothetical protein